MKTFIILVFGLILSSCTMIGKNPKPAEVEVIRPTDTNVIKKFELGGKYLDSGNFKMAADTFDSILVQYPSSELDLVTLFNSGAAHEGMGHCKKSALRYRKVIKLGKGRFKKLEAQALYRLGQAYTCLGMLKKSLAAYADLWSRRNYLPYSVSEAELPVKFGIAYSLNGNDKEAQKYFQKAGQGLGKLQSLKESSLMKQKKLAKTLFFMGDLRRISPDTLSPENYLKSIKNLQGYLLKSMELSGGAWSKKASKQILKAYDQTWIYLSKKKSKKDLNQREFQALKNDIAKLTLGNIEDLKLQRFPEESEALQVSLLFSEIEKHKVRLKKYLAKNVIGNTLTPEAQRRQGVKGDGRTYKPDPKLEEKMKTNRKLPTKPRM